MSRISGSSYDSRLMSRSGDGSTLSLDFTAMGGVLDPRITFSRADATARATFINSLGYVETVATAQAPRFTFSETSIGTPRGLLLEAPATNYLPFSNTLQGGSWFTGNNGAGNGPTITNPYTATNPANGSTSTRIQFPIADGGGAPRLYYITSQTLPYTMSLWMKSNTAGNHTVSLFQNDAWVDFTVTPTWQRFQTTRTSGGALIGFFFLGNTSTTLTPDILVYGAQLEAGSSPASSYIPTGAAAVTRAVDTAIIAAGTNFSSWYTGGTTGTFVTEWCRCSPTTTQRTVIATSDVPNQHLHQYIAATTSRLRLADKVPAFIETTNASVDNSINKGAFSYSGSVQSLCLNGGTVVPGTLAFSVAPTFLSIGGPSTNGTSITDTAVVLNNAIRKIKYFPTRLSDGQIQGLSTL